jgi:predicted Ser/Thr protein kinase
MVSPDSWEEPVKPLRATDPPGVGEFTLLGRLGAGGMGQVYLGATRSGRPVAVKIIRAEIAADPAFRARFVREVEAARRVGGFWTASVVAADPDAESPWLATEYVPGPSLQDAVAQHGPLPAAAVRVLGARLAEALAAIHAAGLVHRDLKPANVLLAPDRPVVIDFGIARAFQTDSAALTAVIGTPSYMSPEQIQGEPLSPASDVFSLGSTLVFALVGRGPFNTGSGEGIIFRVVAEQPDLTGVPADLHDLIAGCLAKDPAQRPTTDALLARLGPAASAATTPYGEWQPPAHDPAAGLVTGGAHPAPVPDPAAPAAAPPAAPPAASPAASPAAPPAASPAAPPAAGPAAPAVAGAAVAGAAVAGAAVAGAARPAPAPTLAVTTIYSGIPPGRRVARHLVAGERFRAQWRPHVVQLVPSLAAGAGATLLLVLLALFAIGYLDAAWFAVIPAVMLAGVLAWLALRVFEWRGDRLVLTDQRILLLVRAAPAAVPLATITDVRRRQSALGRLFHYGTITLRLAGAGSPVRVIRWLPEPEAVHRRLLEAWNAAR